MRKEILTATHLSGEIRKLVNEIARAQGITVSEYIRNLIIDDLEKRSIITTKIEAIKEDIRNHRG